MPEPTPPENIEIKRLSRRSWACLITDVDPPACVLFQDATTSERKIRELCQQARAKIKESDDDQ